MIDHKQIGTIAYLGGVMAVPEPFNWAWGNMLVFSHEALCGENEHIHIERTKLSLHDYARNELLRGMRGEWILMLDTDVTFDPDLAARMVATMMKYRVDVLTGLYCYKAPPNYPVLYVHNKENDRHEIVAGWDRSLEIFPIDSAGAGCLLVRRPVFERITKEFKCNPFDRMPGKGEDHSFFIRCRELGIKAYCAWQVQLQHLNYYGVSLADYDPPAKPDHEFDMEFAPA